MADILAVEGDLVVIKFSDGADPAVFTPKCAINLDRAIDLTNNLTGTAIPNCDDPSKPDKMIYRVTSQEGTCSGGGIYDLNNAAFFEDLFTTGASTDVQIDIGGVGGRRITTKLILTSLGIAAPHKNSCTNDMAFQMSDEIAFEAIA